MSNALDEVAQAVMLIDKNGSVELQIAMAKTGGRLIVAGKVKTKIPTADPESGLYFLGAKGLQKEDPMQGVLEGMTKPMLDSRAPVRYDPATGARISATDSSDPEPSNHEERT